MSKLTEKIAERLNDRGSDKSRAVSIGNELAIVVPAKDMTADNAQRVERAVEQFEDQIADLGEK